MKKLIVLALLSIFPLHAQEPEPEIANTDDVAAAQAAAIAAAELDATDKADASQDFAIQRGNHTGFQAQSTVTGLEAALATKETPAGASTQITSALAGETNNNLAAIAAPLVGNDNTQGYRPGSKWIHSGVTYWCISSATASAIWIKEETPWAGYHATRELWQRRMMRKDSRYVLPSLEPFKLAFPTAIHERADVIAGNVRCVVIGNSFSYEAWPQQQFEEAFGSLRRDGTYVSNEITSSSGGVTLAGGASFIDDQTLTPSGNGYVNLPTGGSVTQGSVSAGTGTGMYLAYVRQPGAGDLFIEVSADGGSSWTHYTTTIDCDGALGYLTHTVTGWTKGDYIIRLSSSGGTCKVAWFGVTGALGHLHIHTGSGSDYTKWSPSNLVAGTVEGWLPAYDPHIVFVRYSNPQALSTGWADFVSRITAACPNAQIIVTGEHSGSQGTTRDQNDNEKMRRNDSLRLACQALPNFSLIDVWNWLPNQADAIAMGALDADTVHLLDPGRKVVRAAQWEFLRPWLFPKPALQQAKNNPRAREQFDNQGWSRTAVLQSDLTINNSDVNQTLFTWTGLPPEGWYELDMMIVITSNSTARAKLGLTGNFNSSSDYRTVLQGTYWSDAGTFTRLNPPFADSGALDTNFPAGAFNASGSTMTYRSTQLIYLNQVSTSQADFSNSLTVRCSQEVATAYDTVFERGSRATLRKANHPSYGGAIHRGYLPQ